VYAAAGTGAAVVLLLAILGGSVAAIARLEVFRRDLRGRSGGSSGQAA
jgi:hypothetical protein